MEDGVTPPREKTDLCLTPFSKITEERVRWLWPAVVPYGKLTLFVGHPGEGKSLATLDLAVRVSAGRQLPDGSAVMPANVLLSFCEDGAGDTVKPRLRAAGANLAKVFETRRRKERDGTETLLDLSNDLHDLSVEIERTEAKLLVFDPITAYLGTNVNSWKDDEVRRLLEPVGSLADATGCAVVAVMHLNKQMGQDPRARVTGSIAFTGVARSVMLFGPHPEDQHRELHEQRKICAPVKMNLTKAPEARVYRIHENSEGIAVLGWEAQTSLTANDLLAPPPSAATDGKLDKAILLLQTQLVNGGVPAADLFSAAKQHGISVITLRRAKEKLNILASQEAYKDTTRWRWSLPKPVKPKAARR